MGEFKRAAVYVKEVPSVPPPPVAAPTPLGIVGFTLKGPSNKALKVESFDDFKALFGDFTLLSLVPLQLDKYFNNGGQIAYIVRVTPVGSLTSDERFLGESASQKMDNGDGATTRYMGFLPGAPIAETTLAIAATDGSGGPIAVTDDGSGHLVGDVASVGVNFIDYATGEYDVTFDVSPGGSATLNLVNDALGAGGNVAITSGLSLIATGMAGGSATTPAIGTLTATTGLLTVDGETFTLNDGTNPAKIFQFFKVGPLIPGNIQVTVTNAMTAIQVAKAILDAVNGVGATLAITAAAAGPAITASYTRSRWEFDASSEGSWGNSIMVEVQGSANFKKQDRQDGDEGDGTAGPYGFTITGAPLAKGSVMITAGHQMAYDDGNGTLLGDVPSLVNLVNDNVGAAGNVAITDTVAAAGFLVTGMAGGAPAVNATGTITAVAGNAIVDGETFTVGDGISAPVVFEFDKNGVVSPGRIAVAINNTMASQQVANAIKNAVNGVGASLLVSSAFTTGAVSYDTGVVSVTFAAAVLATTKVRSHQNGYSLFDLTVYEQQADGEFLVQEVFDALNFEDSSSEDYVTTVVNETGGGSLYIQVTTGQGGILPSLQRWARVQQIGVGDGITRRYQYTLPNPGTPVLPTDPFSVKVVTGTTALTYQEGLDDGVGFLTGANLDPFGVNQIDYASGTIDFQFKIAPNPAQPVYVIFAKLQATDSVQLSGGSNGTGIISSSQIADPGLEPQKKGVYAFNVIEFPLNVIVPDFAESSVVTKQLEAYAEIKKDRFIIACTSKGLSPTEAVNYTRRDIRSRSSYLAVYYPWLRSLDRSVNKVRTIPPLGHVAGMYARVDRTRSEGKSPAGTADGQMFDVTGIERIIEPQDENLIYPVHINPILFAEALGIYVNGARTQSVDKDFQFISTRRLFIGYRRRALNDLKYALHEPIGPALYSRIKSTLVGIAMEYFQKGALAGTNPREAFEVLVDEVNTIEIADQGIVKSRVSLAPAKPAEFISVELTVLQRTRTITVTA